MAGFINASLRTRIAGSWFRMISRCRWWMIGFADHGLGTSSGTAVHRSLEFPHGKPCWVPRKLLYAAERFVGTIMENAETIWNHHKLRECQQMIITRVRRCYCLHLHHGHFELMHLWCQWSLAKRSDRNRTTPSGSSCRSLRKCCQSGDSWCRTRTAMRILWQLHVFSRCCTVVVAMKVRSYRSLQTIHYIWGPHSYELEMLGLSHWCRMV